MLYRGQVAQWLEHLVYIQGLGSNPVRTSVRMLRMVMGPVCGKTAKMCRVGCVLSHAICCYETQRRRAGIVPGGPGFKPQSAHHFNAPNIFCVLSKW